MPLAAGAAKEQAKEAGAPPPYIVSQEGYGGVVRCFSLLALPATRFGSQVRPHFSSLSEMAMVTLFRDSSYRHCQGPSSGVRYNSAYITLQNGHDGIVQARLNTCAAKNKIPIRRSANLRLKLPQNLARWHCLYLVSLGYPTSKPSIM